MKPRDQVDGGEEHGAMEGMWGMSVSHLRLRAGAFRHHRRASERVLHVQGDVCETGYWMLTSRAHTDVRSPNEVDHVIPVRRHVA